MEDTKPVCVVCKQSSDEVPLLKLDFKETEFRICPQHLPILIHNPQQLVGMLPGAEGLQASNHND